VFPVKADHFDWAIHPRSREAHHSFNHYFGLRLGAHDRPSSSFLNALVGVKDGVHCNVHSDYRCEWLQRVGCGQSLATIDGLLTA
jgi:hypothetical protein